MNKIPTFEELAKADNWYDGDQLSISQMAELSRKHTALHIQAASEQAKASVRSNGEWVSSNTDASVNKSSILNAYPLTNIK